MRVLDLSYHPLDVRSGKWVDLSRFGNHGMLYGGARPYMIAPGVMGYWFDGSSGYVNCGSDEDLNVPNMFTYAAWFNVNTFKLSYLMEKSGEASEDKGGPVFYISSAGNLVASFYDSNGNWVTPAVFTPISTDVWYYAVYTWNGTTEKLYLSGKLKDSETPGATCGTTAKPLIISGRWDGGPRFLDGLVAQPTVEDRAWSEAEVRENMYRSPIYRMLRGLPHSWIYTKVPWKQTQGGIYVP